MPNSVFVRIHMCVLQSIRVSDVVTNQLRRSTKSDDVSESTCANWNNNIYLVDIRGIFFICTKPSSDGILTVDVSNQLN